MSKGLMCLMSSAHIITDYMRLHNTHTHTHLYLSNPEIITLTCGESQHILVVGLRTNTEGDWWLITFIVGELACALMPHACKINNMLNEVSLGPNAIYQWSFCADYGNNKYHIIYVNVCPCLTMCYIDTCRGGGVIQRGEYIIKIPLITQ